MHPRSPEPTTHYGYSCKLPVGGGITTNDNHWLHRPGLAKACSLPVDLRLLMVGMTVSLTSSLTLYVGTASFTWVTNLLVCLLRSWSWCFSNTYQSLHYHPKSAHGGRCQLHSSRIAELDSHLLIIEIKLLSTPCIICISKTSHMRYSPEVHSSSIKGSSTFPLSNGLAHVSDRHWSSMSSTERMTSQGGGASSVIKTGENS